MLGPATWLATLSLAGAALGAGTAPDLSSLDAEVTGELAARRYPGAAIAIVRGARVIYAKGFGTASLDTGEPVSADMLFRLGSTTKMFTAAALVRLAEQGRLRLDAPVSEQIVGLHPAIGSLTAHQLLSHTAGLRDEAPMYGSHDDSELGHRIRRWDEKQVFAPPGAIYSYSNPGYWLAGYLAEVVEGKPFADVLASSLFTPLGMTRTTVRPLMAMTWPLAQGHDEDEYGRLRVVRPAADNAATWPAGSMYSSVLDLARWIIALLNEGRIEGREAIGPALLEKLSAPRARPPLGRGSYGYGLAAGMRRGVEVVSHGGSRLGYGSWIEIAPRQRVGIIVLVNRSGGQLPRSVEKALSLLLPLGPEEEAGRKPQPVPAAEALRYSGEYRNGALQVVLRLEGTRLLFVRGNQAHPVERLEAGRFVAGEHEFALVEGPDGTVEYLHQNGRSLRRAK